MRIKNYILLMGLFVLLITFSIHTGISFAGNKKETKNLQLPGMVYIPAGWFWMGCNPEENHCSVQEKPYHKVYLDAYYIDKNDVTVDEYTKCVNAGICKAPHIENNCNYGVLRRENNPINCINWNQANTYCQWKGKQLPTEAQWEKAARGTDGRIYPWGNTWDCKKSCNSVEPCKQFATCAVGSYPQGASPYGVMDMSGNVWNWCSDWYDINYYVNSPDHNPTGPEWVPRSQYGPYRVIRGNSWNFPRAWQFHISRRSWGLSSYWFQGSGFRCIRSIAPKPQPIFTKRVPLDESLQGMVYIPRGSFMMGCSPQDRYCGGGEKPYHKVYLDAYYIDKNDVTVNEYTKCVNAGTCTQPHTGHKCNWKISDKGDNPINCVNWNQANTYCQWAGKQLPTEAQWEKAARGTEGRIYPWGNKWDADKACFSKDSTCVVGIYPQGASPYGVMDMSGDVLNWCSDWYDIDYYAHSTKRNPQGPKNGQTKVLRGTSWDVSGYFRYFRAANRSSMDPLLRYIRSGVDSDVGFRCVREDIKQIKDVQQGRGHHK